MYHTHTRARAPTHAHARTHTHACTHTPHTRTHVHMHTHTHTHTHKCTIATMICTYVCSTSVKALMQFCYLYRQYISLLLLDWIQGETEHESWALLDEYIHKQDIVVWWWWWWWWCVCVCVCVCEGQLWIINVSKPQEHIHKYILIGTTRTTNPSVLDPYPITNGST